MTTTLWVRPMTTTLWVKAKDTTLWVRPKTRPSGSGMTGPVIRLHQVFTRVPSAPTIDPQFTTRASTSGAREKA